MKLLALLVLLGSLPAGETPVRLEARDQEGRPVSGALAGLGSDPAGITDESGRLSLSLPAGRETPVRLLAPGSWWARGTLLAVSAMEAPVVIPLEPPRRIAGRVIDGGTGAGIPDALVWVDAQPGAAGRTDRLGGYGLAVPFAPPILYLRAEAPGYGGTVVAAGAAEKVPDTLVLRRIRGAAGRIVDAVGRPVAGAEVRLVSWASSPEGASQGTTPVDTRSDARGAFRVPRLALGRIQLFVTAPGFLTASKDNFELAAGQGDADLGTVILEKALFLSGTVTDPQGRPLESVEVLRLDVGSQPPEVTGPEGTFRLEGFRAGETVRLHFARKGYLPATLSGLTVPAEPLKPVLHPAARIAGIVVDEAGEPVPGATLFAATDEGEMVGVTHSDAEGRFTFEDVKPGLLRLSATAPRFVQTVVEAKGEEVEIVLRGGASIEGTVTMGAGLPAAGARVTLVDHGGQGFPASLAPVQAIADEEGWYRLEGVAEGIRTVQAEWTGLPPATREVRVRGGSNRLDLLLQSGFEVSGRVTTPAGNPLEGVELSLSTLQEAIVPPSGVMSGPDGTFRFPAVPDGLYQLKGFRPGYAGAPREIQVQGIAVQGADLRLERGSSLTGRITGLDSGALPQVEVRASSPWSGRDQVVRADLEGLYRFESLGPGGWSVTAQIPQTSRATRGTVTIEPGREGMLDLDFGAGLSLSGQVERDGVPVIRAWVIAQNGPASGSSQTDENGRFRIEGLAPGHFTVLVVHPLSGSQSSHEMDLERSQEIAFDLTTAGPVGPAQPKGETP